MRKILVVEDDSRMREFIKIYIENSNYICIQAENGEEALDKISDSVSLVLLDLMMPKLDGFHVCKKIREEYEIPIIILTAVNEELAEVKCYEMGADDYITKPFKAKVLMAKIKRFLERYNNDIAYADLFGLKINRESRRVYLGENNVKLAPKEYKLLMYLIDNKDIVLSREQILDFVWKDDLDINMRVVDNHIKKLRNKLDIFGKHIETVISVGYVLR